ncbi:MAG: ABC transporter ATP-binding protein [Bacteroidota bacterium]
MTTTAENKKPSLKRAKSIFRFLSPYRLAWSASLFFLILSSLTSMVFPLLMGNLFGASEASAQNISLADLDNATSVLILLMLVFAAQSVFSFFRVYLGSIATESALTDIRQTVYQRLISLPVNFYNSNKVGELTSRLSADVTLLEESFTWILSEFIRQIIVVIVGITALALISWKLSLVMLSTIPVMALTAVFFGRYIKKLSKKAQDKVAESNSVVEETLTAITSVKAYTNEFYEMIRYKKSTNEAKSLLIKGAVWRGAFISFIIFCMFGAIVFVIWQGVLMMQAGELTDKGLVSFIMFSIFIGASFGSLPDLWSRLQKAIGATERLMDLMDEENEKVETAKQTEKTNLLKGKVEFRNVEFSYATRKDIEVLRGISFIASPGEQIAVVGPSGSGKSTIASLLLRFYEPVNGEILFDDKISSSFGLTELRNSMAIVPQEVILFGGTIRENIAYGKPGASDEEIWQAAQKANALEFIEKFPEKLETLVGDRGVQLSGGQKQRIAIARAVLKNPTILILDEATSSLDSESESLVQEALDKLMKGRTSFVIAHRLSTIKNSDKILVLENGGIIESGNHQSLLANSSGLYTKLSRMQGVGN